MVSRPRGRYDLCQFNRNTLAAAFGLEKPINPARIDPLVLLGGCVKYCQSLQRGEDYVNPNTGKIHPHPDSKWEYKEHMGAGYGSGLEKYIAEEERNGWMIIKVIWQDFGDDMGTRWKAFLKRLKRDETVTT